ncbi:MAG TPA: hypothetical protein VMH80_06180 [Bryobacteraceae bacterium]|nr:hypothetical protein [Bryobacteraceae bacterium]
MTPTDQKIEEQFDALLKEGHDILKRSGFDPNENQYYHFPSNVDYQRFRVRASNLINRVCGSESSHSQAIRAISEDKRSSANSWYMKDYVGILEAAHKDYKAGCLVEIRYLVRADLLSDFLAQAECLLSNGYAQAAASLAGAVLEDTLRKLCDRNGISYTSKAGIEVLNTELARKVVYDKLIQKEITAKADLRNSADHGHFDKVRHQDVQDMLRWVQRFVTERLH